MNTRWLLALALTGCVTPSEGKGDDRDGDGFTDTDCDDNDAAIGEASIWFPDTDGDGHGTDAGATAGCERPEGHVANHDDCDDADAAVFPGNLEVCDGKDNDCNDLVDLGDPDLDPSSVITVYVDADADGFGVEGGGTSACELGPFYTETAGDCDDADPLVHPDAEELCNGQDDDCDTLIDDADPDATGTAWYVDTDADGYGADASEVYRCAAPEGTVATGGDCDDTTTARHPGAAERDCTDPIDYNCDGSVGYGDIDHDGSPACEDCEDTQPDVNPDGLETCNGLDDDCDGEADEAGASGGSIFYADSDGDGYGDASVPTPGCSAPAGTVADDTDCDDTSATTHPGATELCNGEDDDCDGEVDGADEVTLVSWYADADGDGSGDPLTSELACSAPAGYVTDATDCDDGDADVSPLADERCNSIDDDCDGDTDEDSAVDAMDWYVDADGDSYGEPGASTRSCSAPTGSVADGTDCDDDDDAVNPGAVELCNGLDDDCDGDTDEDSAVDAPTWYDDVDADGFGDAGSPLQSCSAPIGAVADDTDCDDGDAAIHPTATELCNSVDDDCDGDTDEADAADATTWYFDADGDLYGDPTRTEIACTQPSRSVADGSDCDDADPLVSPAGTESCNTVDDDCNGTVDDSAIDPELWYEDADGDGYGDELGAAASACDAPAGYVSDQTDCDDSSVDVNPGESEACDTLDNDCDGDRDESGCSCAVEDYGGTLYLYCTTTATWTTAQTNCWSWGYDLVSIGSSAENTEVVDQAVSRSTGYWWMGFNDRTTEGTWAWSDGSAITYTNWQTGEPNDSGKKEDCGQLNRFTSYTWNDAQCSTSLAYVCEE
jgi:hypothetical protein